MSYEFQTTTHGKWILAGEHAVLRGHGALVFPFNNKKLTLSYHASTTDLNAAYEGESGADTHLLFWSVIEQGMQLLGHSLNSVSGHFHLYSDIPVGAGLGASAALCVAMARWFASRELISVDIIQSFAQELEHLFHGKSSGLDIAGVAASSGMYFKQGVSSPLIQTWQPQWFLSSCGQVGMTSHCIQQVASLKQKNPSCAEKTDALMADCVRMARRALETHSSDSEEQLTQAINTAADCFQQWGLISDSLQQHMHYLRKAGAVAVKPTGSGVGGYVLSLWKTTPPPLSMELSAC